MLSFLRKFYIFTSATGLKITGCANKIFQLKITLFAKQKHQSRLQ